MIDDREYEGIPERETPPPWLAWFILLMLAGALGAVLWGGMQIAKWLHP